MRTSSTIQLIIAVLLAGAVWAVDNKATSRLSSFTWRHTAEWFGGFSAIHIENGGREMIAVTDRATLVTARVNREAGSIADIQITGHWPLLSSKGRTLTKRNGDSEGIAVAPDGGLLISFEGTHRVAYYSAPGAWARVLPRPKVFDGFEGNGSLEALAIDKFGHLYTMPEENRTNAGDIPVYRWDGQAWSTPFVLPQRGKYLPVAADFGPDGRLYVLERDVGWTGFRSRLRRWQVDGDTLRAEEVVFQSGTGAHDNLEGVSIWRDDKGRLRATMVSDDNFLALQRTELVEYLLPD
ncbi:esterase-like activity of phytase family protein [Ruegeria sp. Ofav3-42]|uniref:esterase-like activity of phytase family protein n=1 Tax=Ruegeria sp. Ofav3-42 TaxID=2917759 RepID=UPI001EF5A11C|nr:esterase-like activity of phytase family protein [Ruegeria sp. Ofav3-42]MCG7521124.1 esterase-like activity of phytase family protein [Ruegeria sp. Ofav3-42]